jgi:hypothetical protein
MHGTQKGTTADSGRHIKTAHAIYNIKIQKHIKMPQFLKAFRTTINVKNIAEFLVLNSYGPEGRLC